MQLNIGDSFEGKVLGLVKYGAFVELPEGKKGMVHISEISTAFVNSVGEYLEVGQKVKVKIISITDDGKIALSIKQVDDGKYALKKKNEEQTKHKKNISDQNKDKKLNKAKNKPRKTNTPPVFSNEKKEKLSFEDMMSKFKQLSDEKISDLKRSTESKHGGFSRRGNGKHQQ